MRLRTEDANKHHTHLLAYLAAGINFEGVLNHIILPSLNVALREPFFETLGHRDHVCNTVAPQCVDETAPKRLKKRLLLATGQGEANSHQLTPRPFPWAGSLLPRARNRG